jgi:hypothetical protein
VIQEQRYQDGGLDFNEMSGYEISPTKRNNTENLKRQAMLYFTVHTLYPQYVPTLQENNHICSKNYMKHAISRSLEKYGVSSELFKKSG